MPSIPFVVGQWVRGEKFYGRAALIEEVLEGPRNWLWLLGTRRIGKTSFLKQLELLSLRPNGGERRYFPVFWDFQGADDPGELHRTFSDALLDAEERLEEIGAAPSEVEGSDLFETLGRMRRKVRSAGRTLLLLCDEVEELIKLNRKDPALLRKLRQVMQSREDVRSVLASTIRLWALADERGDTSPFLHGFTPPLYIHGLTDEEARALIRQANLPSASRPAFDDQAMEEIRSRCDNHPYLIQLVCKRCMELGDLAEAVEQVASDQMVSYFFSVDFDMLGSDERDVLRIIAETSSATSESIQDQIAAEPGELGGILHKLEHLGYVRRNPERRFELVNYFFRRWFSEQPHSRLPVTGSGTPEARRGTPGARGGTPGARDWTPDVRGGEAGGRQPGKGTRTTSEQTTASNEGERSLFDGRYALLGQVGKGATGVVYRASDEMLRETIAIKILKPEYSSNADMLERFRQEILLPRDIGHPNIVKVYHLGDCRGQRYLTMKWIEGPTLAAVIARKGALPVEGVVKIATRLASALEAAHSRKVIHRDIKPQNVMMEKPWEPVLTDFGLARLLTGPGITSSGMFLGTPDYASPEQARLLPPDERSDIYSLGVVIFEMATGKRPFASNSTKGVLEMHRNTAPPDPRRARPEIPPALSKLILHCLEKEPARRCPSARALRMGLEAMGGR